MGQCHLWVAFDQRPLGGTAIGLQNAAYSSQLFSFWTGF